MDKNIVVYESEAACPLSVVLRQQLLLAHHYSCHCFPPLLWHDSHPAEDLLLPPTYIHVPGLKAPSSPHHVCNLALFSLMCTKQRWMTSQGS